MTIKPKSSERATKIFEEACNVENMEAKFGKTLSDDESAVKNYILTQSPVLGRLPSFEEIINSFGQFPNEKINIILNKLDQLDVIHLNKTKTCIIAAYPFSSSQTSHIITMKKEGFKKMYAMCAVDALGISFMFNCDVSINSKCFHCNDSIKIEIEDNIITNIVPITTMVWCDLEYSCCAATSLCKNINFFSSKDHFTNWQNARAKRRGHLLEIDEALYVGKLFFNNRI